MKYKRNADIVRSTLVVKNNQIFTQQETRIIVPQRYIDIGLGEIGVKTYFLGVFAIVLPDDTYSVMSVCALVELNPYKITSTTEDGADYFVLHFEPNSLMIENINVVKRDDVIYPMMSEFYLKGKVPWFITYDDLGKLFDTAGDYADSKVSKVPEVMEFITSMLGRPLANRSVFIRNAIKSYEDVSVDKVVFVPLESVYYSMQNTVNKLAGAYFHEGIVSALVTKSEQVGSVEKILRA